MSNKYKTVLFCFPTRDGGKADLSQGQWENLGSMVCVLGTWVRAMCPQLPLMCGAACSGVTGPAGVPAPSCSTLLSQPHLRDRGALVLLFLSTAAAYFSSAKASFWWGCGFSNRSLWPADRNWRLIFLTWCWLVACLQMPANPLLSVSSPESAP